MKTKTEKPLPVNGKNKKEINKIENVVQPSVETEKPESKKRPIEIARETLKAHSHAVKELVASGTYETINDALIDTIYKDKKNVEFKSYREWKKEGYQVQKGEKAFLLWGRPKEHQVDEDKNKSENLNKGPMEENHDAYFPVVYVFSNAQVNKREHSLEHDEEKAMSELDSIRNSDIEKSNEFER